MPELSVVIPTFRRHAVLRRTLAALSAQTADPATFEVLVVDDPEEDDSAAVAAVLGALGRPARHLHRTRRGVSAARNTGWREARAPVVLFLGDDILAAPTLVAEHLAFHAAHPDQLDGLLGKVRWADELPLTPLMVWLEDGIQSEYGRLDTGAPPSIGDFLTSNISVKRSLLERAGGFDEERFPFLYEDTDLGLRLDRLGLRLAYRAAAAGEHLHAPTLPEWRERMAATARAEQRWVELHPEQEPYFERRLRPALAGRPARRWLLPLAVPLARRGPGRLRARVAYELDLHFRRELAPAFLAAWDATDSG